MKTTYLHKGKILQFRLDTDRNRTFEIVEHPGAVAMVPILDEKILLVKQWRRAVDRVLYEIPAGTLEKHEDITKCAQRELQEEVGYFSHDIKPLGGFYTAPGFCTEYIHLFVATKLEKKPLQADDDEDIEVVAVTLAEALSMIKTNEICDAKTIAALLRYAYV